MRVTVLGGSAAGPNPGAGCSGYIVADDETTIVLDLGPGTVPELRKHIEPHLLDAIIVSHMHLDHMLDLATLRYGMKYGPNAATAALPVYVPPGGAERLHQLALAFSSANEAASFYDGVYDIREYDPFQILHIGGVSVSFAAGIHYLPSWAMRVTASTGAALGYTADTGPAADLDGLLNGVSLVIAEASLLEPGPEPDASRGHLTGAEAGALAHRVGADTLLLTHMWHEHGPSRIKEQAAKTFHGKIEIARPGLMLDVT